MFHRSEGVEEGGQQKTGHGPDRQSAQDGPHRFPEGHGGGGTFCSEPGLLLVEVHRGGVPDGLRGPHRLVPDHLAGAGVAEGVAEIPGLPEGEALDCHGGALLGKGLGLLLGQGEPVVEKGGGLAGVGAGIIQDEGVPGGEVGGAEGIAAVDAGGGQVGDLPAALGTADEGHRSSTFAFCFRSHYIINRLNRIRCDK